MGALNVVHSKVLTNPDNGIEDKVYGADYVSASSHTISGTTGSRVPFGDGAGGLKDDAALSFNSATGTLAATALTISGLTATRVPFAGTGGALTDSAAMTFAAGVLTVGGVNHATSLPLSIAGTAVETITGSGVTFAQPVTISGLTSGRVPYVGTAGLLGDSANLLYSETSGPRFQVGSTGTSQGWIAGQKSNNQSGLWSSALTPSTQNHSLGVDNTGNSELNAPTGKVANLSINGAAVLTAAAASITAAQPHRAADGSQGTPAYSFTNATNVGIYQASGALRFAANGAQTMLLQGGGVLYLPNDSALIGLGASQDVILMRDAANTLAQRNGTAEQVFRIGPSSNYCSIQSSGGNLQFGVNTGNAVWTMTSGGKLNPLVDNAYDIGLSGADPRSVRAGTSFVPSSNGAASLGTADVGFKALYLDYTDTATVGDVTINKPSGAVNLGAGGTTLVLTNSLITAKSKVIPSADSAPGNLVAVQFIAVSAAGSCTITAVPAVTNQTKINFVVVSAD